MAISNSIDFNVSRDDIITEALEQLGVLGEGEEPTTDQINSSSRTLNMLIKTWQADQMNLFAVSRYYLFLDYNRIEYLLDNSATDTHFTESFVETTTTADTAVNATTVNLTSVDGISVGDNIKISGITQQHWTTVATVGASSVTLDAGIPFATTAGAVVFAYTTKAQRPMKIPEGYVHITRGNTDIPVGHISRRRYNRLSVKDTRGLVNQYYYDPQISPDANLFVWPTSDTSDNYLILFVQRTLSDLDTGTDNPEIPQEWYMPLALNLAVDLAPKYGIPDQQYYKLTRRAEMYYEMASGFDEELYTSVYFTVDRRGEEL